MLLLLDKDLLVVADLKWHMLSSCLTNLGADLPHLVKLHGKAALLTVAGHFGALARVWSKQLGSLSGSAPRAVSKSEGE